MAQINLPNKWTPRWYQIRLFAKLDSGIKRVVCVWHRRAGKDVAMINYAAMNAMRRVQTLWHVFPTQKQARVAIWEGITKDGTRIMDQAFPGFSNPKAPGSIVARTRDDAMMVEFKNGSIWRLVGGDNYNSLVGSNVGGVVFSEFAITDPRAWDYVRPILLESGGWAAFISTPRGHNHYYNLYKQAISNSKWYGEILTVKDTGAIPLSLVDEERESGMHEEKIKQEYFCDFSAANVGSIYGSYIEALEKKGRIGDVPYDPTYPVDTSWDLGVVDKTAIWFSQRVGNNVHMIDYHAEPAKGLGLPHFLGLCRDKGYAYGRHIGPHEMTREWVGSGETPVEVALKHGFHFVAAPKLLVETGLTMAQNLLPRCRFDDINCREGLDALKQYQYEYDEEKRVFGNKPLHDWASDGADALRMLAQTPATYGAIPLWAQQQPQNQGWGQQQMGHNGGPPLNGPGGTTSGQYDPLAEFRG